MIVQCLLIGGSGQLGKAILQCKKSLKRNAWDIPRRWQLDIADGANICEWFRIQPAYDLIVNVAAETRVDFCENNEFHSFNVNALSLKYIPEGLTDNKGVLVHISSDYVFPGTDSSSRKETDPVCPINAYGRTKWAGEVFVRALCPKHFIVRTAWLYGLHGKNFVKTILKKARETGRISVVADQYGSPTFANDLAEAILKLAQTDRYGTYHCTNAGVCSWFELASAAVDIAGISCKKEAITTEEYRRRFPQSARRPMYSALDNTKIAGVLGKPLRPWREALEEFIDALQKEEAQDAGN